jgi:CubicO group peptidase (beta-lactamase class C family)
MQALSQRVDSVLEAAIAGQRIVGGVALVAQRGAVVYQRAIGLADRDAGRAMTEATPFRLASLTKQITTVTALALVERGVLAFDQPVTRWLPEFRPRFGDASPTITLHHLLSHTSGLSYRFFEPGDGPYHRANVSDGLEQPGLSIDDNLRRLASVPLLSPPGARFQYSLSTDVLGGVVERAGDAPLPDLVARHVTEPLGLDGFAFTASPRSPPRSPCRTPMASPARRRSRSAMACRWRSSRRCSSPSRRRARSIPRRTRPAAPAWSAAPRRTPALIDRMFSDHIAGQDSEMLGPGCGYGYSVSVLRDPAAAKSSLSAGAVRWGGAYGHSWWIDPARETSAVLLTNTAFEGMSGALREEFQRAVHA